MIHLPIYAVVISISLSDKRPMPQPHRPRSEAAGTGGRSRDGSRTIRPLDPTAPRAAAVRRAAAGRWAIRAAAGVLLAASAGCLPIPHSHVKQPAVLFRVSDPAGRPVSGATVHLYSGVRVSNRVLHREAGVTDSLGRAGFSLRRERHLVLFLMPDAEAPWYWAWCVDGPGFRTALGTMDAPLPEVAVALVPADSRERCPERPEHVNRVEAVERPGS